MFCSQCGVENKSDSRFCTGCGNPLQTSTVETIESFESPRIRSVLAQYSQLSHDRCRCLECGYTGHMGFVAANSIDGAVKVALVIVGLCFLVLIPLVAIAIAVAAWVVVTSNREFVYHCPNCERYLDFTSKEH